MASPGPSANRLSQESSPYLRQHAHNPVDWYPWSLEALERARQLDRPIFLSIGYSACHWCHVMEHESFEDAETARILNDNFVSIKVDREERPDLDQIYMTAVQMLTGQGGWPMSMFLTPDLKPFYGGTYFPPDERYGRPSFKRLLLALAEAWRDRRDEVLRSAGQIAVNLQGLGSIEPSNGTDLTPDLIRAAATQLERACDRIHGGFGQAPKFPHAMDLRLLLRAWQRFGDHDALLVARLTLDHMAQGGMYDHIGGGFHRYSTDERWLVPHFEKMLYDNALLAVAYLEAFQATRESTYRDVVQETLAYVLREMTSPEGPFFSSQDADSEGVEGKFFVWSAAEIEAVLGRDLADAFTDVYGVTQDGNWEGHNILNRGRTLAQTARLRNVSETALHRQITETKVKLYARREARVHPGRDEKILTAWNGLMIDALAQAALPLGEPRYAQAAAKAAGFILEKMRASDGRLLRTASAGAPAKLNAYLEDYAYFINALISLYEATFEPHWIEAAVDLAGVMLSQFWDPAEAGFFFTGNDHETLIARSKDPHDSSVPAGNSVAVMALLRLATLTGRDDFRKRAEETLRLFSGLMQSAPQVAGQMLIALDFYLGPVEEFALVGDAAATGTRRVLTAITGAFRPNKVLALKSDAFDVQELDKLVPLLKDKRAEGTVTTYICRNFACQAPLIGVDAVEKALRQ